MNSRLHLCFLLAIAFVLGAMVDNIVFRSPPSDVVAFRQAALDADEEIAALNDQINDERWLAAREISDLQEERLRLYSLLPDVATPCYFPDLHTE